MLVRERALAPMSRRDRSGSDQGDGDKNDKSDKSEPADDKKPSTRPPTGDETQPVLMSPRQRTDKDKGDTPEPAEPDPASRETMQIIDPPAPKGEPWPDATPAPMAPVRARVETVAMPTVQVGRPPDMPTSTAPPPLALGSVEDPTHMPGPRDIPAGEPDDRAPAPGRVPPGDSRSLRRDNEFALVYRLGTYVISRTGAVGTRGQWRVVEYPTSASASHAYAKECSRFVSDGFSDYRE